MSQRGQQRGFTLLELMISLAVMAMIALMIGSALSTTARIITRSAGYGAFVDHALARRELISMVEATLPTAFPGSQGAIASGTAESFTFQAIIDDGVFWPGAPVTATLVLSDLNAVTVTATGISDSTKAGLTTIIRLSDPDQRLGIRYYGRRSATESPAWYPVWSADQGLPILIKVTMTNGGKVQPSIVIQPAKRFRQSEMSLSSLVPPATPSRP
jgi:prepilin-type N-terminal cleavage/methylation domain-containing protein